MSLNSLGAGIVGLLLLVPATGCGSLRRSADSPVDAGLNTNNLDEPIAQQEADVLVNPRHLSEAAEKLKRVPTPEQVARRRAVLPAVPAERDE